MTAAAAGPEAADGLLAGSGGRDWRPVTLPPGLKK